MTILFVVDQFDDLNNGTTASARRFVQKLREEGHTVRVLLSGSEGKDKFVLPRLYIPIISSLAKKQGIFFSKPVDSIIENALDGVDIVHFYLPFPLARAVEKKARQKNIPCIAAFHVQAENLTYNIGLKKVKGAGDFFYKFLYHYFYKRFDHIHCPSEFIAGELKRNGYGAELHVISNGISKEFVPQKKIAHDGFNILMTGRLSPEKRQDVLLNAIPLCRHKDEIHLFFAGNGPLLKKYKKIAEKLPHGADFRFYSTEELLARIAETDLYVHTSDIEIEALACMEAFSADLVPLIADAPKSATVSFALDERSLFEHGNPASLAEKIDWWLENPSEREKMAQIYAESARKYSLENSVHQMEIVYKKIIEESK